MGVTRSALAPVVETLGAPRRSVRGGVLAAVARCCAAGSAVDRVQFQTNVEVKVLLLHEVTHEVFGQALYARYLALLERTAAAIVLGRQRIRRWNAVSECRSAPSARPGHLARCQPRPPVRSFSCPLGGMWCSHSARGTQGRRQAANSFGLISIGSSRALGAARRHSRQASAARPDAPSAA